MTPAHLQAGRSPLFEASLLDASLVQATLERVANRTEAIESGADAKTLSDVSTRLPDLTALKRDIGGMTGFLESLRDSIYVDINDFEIRERRKRFAWLLVALKTALWKFLRFYTYRLWSQQNQINGLHLASLDAVHGCYAGKIAQLEAKIKELEERLNRSQPVPPPAESSR